ncbi:MAG: Na/Pi cotransporter family protein [Bacteroidales bacterium]|nr:Na/Pi cotransporter family protein [Bacteroidales bacterium]
MTITLLGALGMFLFGMNMLSSGLQKAAGAGLRKFVASITSNPFKGVLTGMGVTATIQSSSATTVMVVSFVSAGILSLKQAIGVIMGANIGTTMTAWIVSIFGFKADIATLAVPLMAVGFILSISKRNRMRSIGEAVTGFCLLFLGLSFMKGAVPDLRETPEALAFITGFSGKGIASTLLFVMAGTLLTMILQSSSATVALTLIFLDMGYIGFDMAAAMVMGENIGTTITANIAAAMGNVNARRAALAHTVFNVFGVIWVVCLFRPFIALIGLIINAVGLDGSAQTPLYSISMLHTVFNIVNTCILIWFTPQIEKLVCLIIRPRASETADSPKLMYIGKGGAVSTPELAVSEAEKEIQHFGQVVREDLQYIRLALRAGEADFPKWQEKLVKYEEITDKMEYEIANFLNRIDRSVLSDQSNNKIRAMYRIIGEMESLGDSGESIARLLVRAREHSQKLSEKHIADIESMLDLISDAYGAMSFNLKHAERIRNIENAFTAEQAINEKRSELREAELKLVEEHPEEYFESVFYFDLIERLEEMGDYIINISQAVAGKTRSSSFVTENA